jgi:hypothetical protein
MGEIGKLATKLGAEGTFSERSVGWRVFDAGRGDYMRAIAGEAAIVRQSNL